MRVDPFSFLHHGYVLYLFTVLLALALDTLFGANAPLAWVIIQSVIASLAIVPLFLLASDLFGGRVATVAAATHAVLFESFQWEAYALSDSIFQAGVIVALLCGIRAESDARFRPALYASFLFLTFFRPVGFLVPLAYGVWKGAAFVKRRPRAALAVGLALVAAFALLWSVSLSATAPSLGRGYAERDAQGTIVDDDFDLALPPLEEPVDGLLDLGTKHPVYFATLVTLRFLAFFLPFVLRYSAAHLALNAATLLPIILLGVWGMLRALRRATAARFLAIVILVFALFHALTLLDYDFRYRNPVLPVLEIFFAVMAMELVSRVRTPTRAAAARPGNP